MPIHFSRTVRKPSFWVAVFTCGALAATVCVVSGCGPRATAKGGAAPEAEPLGVIVAQPRELTILRTVVQPGTIKAYEETPIFSKLPGFLRDVYVDINDRVKKGDLLAKLWVPEVEQDVNIKAARVLQATADVKESGENLNAAEANVKTMEATVEEANAGVASAKALAIRWEIEYLQNEGYFKRGILDQQNLEVSLNRWKAAKAAEKEADARLTFAKASLVESKSRRDKADADVEVSKAHLGVCVREHKKEEEWFKYARLEAPFDGIVTRRNVHTDHFVQPSNSGTTSKGAEPLFMVMRTDKVRVVMQVPEGDAPLIKDGADAMVTIPALRNREVACTVTRGSYALDTESRTLRVEIFLDNPLKDPKEEMLPGTYVSVRIVADVPNVMCVPSDAIQIKGGSNYCFVVEDGKAKRVNVRTGVQNDHLIRVLYKQLPPAKEDEPGDWVPFTGKEQVILSPLHLVQEGQVVTVKAVEELKDEKRETHTEKH